MYSEIALVVVCDTSDNKHAYRNKLFSKWFDKFNPVLNGKFSKFDLRICNEDGDHAYCSLIIHKIAVSIQKLKRPFLILMKI